MVDFWLKLCTVLHIRGSPIGFFNPAILTKTFLQSHNPNSFYQLILILTIILFIKKEGFSLCTFPSSTGVEIFAHREDFFLLICQGQLARGNENNLCFALILGRSNFHHRPSRISAQFFYVPFLESWLVKLKILVSQSPLQFRISPPFHSQILDPGSKISQIPHPKKPVGYPHIKHSQFDPRPVSLHCVLGQDAHSHIQCHTPPKCINGY